MSFELKRELLGRALDAVPVLDALPLAREWFDWLTDDPAVVAAPVKARIKVARPPAIDVQSKTARSRALPAPSEADPFSLPADDSAALRPAAPAATEKSHKIGDALQAALAAIPGATCAELAAFTGRDKKNVSVNLAHFLNKGIVRAIKGPQTVNGRLLTHYHIVELTEAPPQKKTGWKGQTPFRPRDLQRRRPRRLRPQVTRFSRNRRLVLMPSQYPASRSSRLQTLAS